jgi:hypothetical protein
MSVIVVGIVLVLGILGMLSGYQPTPISPIATQVNLSSNNTTPVIPISSYKPTFNVTKYTTSFDFVGALQGLNATSLYSFNSTKLFNFEYGYNPLALTIANLLSLPADRITPWTYGAIYNVLDANYTKWTSNKTVTLYYYPMNVLGNTVYLNFTYQTDPQFVDAYYQLNRSYPFPPSDKVIVGSLTYKIIKTYSVYTHVFVDYNYYSYIVFVFSNTIGNTIIFNVYWANNVYGTAYLYANGQLVSTQNFYFTVYWWGGSYSNTIYGNVEVPPGVNERVYGSYTLRFYPGSNSYSFPIGNYTVVVVNYYPVGPSVITNDYTFNWHEYNVSVPVKIMVYNGSNPITRVDNQTFHARQIITSIWYTVWSSLPKSYTASITTLDHITFMKYNLTRTWNAGSITINPKSYTSTVGNTINYYLSFSTTPLINEPPSYVFKPIPQLNKTIVLQWSYFFNNYSVAQGLYNVTHGNIDQFNFVLPQLVTSLYKDNLTEHTIVLASFIEPWNVSKVQLNATNVIANSTMIFLPIEIIPNSTYSIIYYALGSPNASPNVTMLAYSPKIFANNDYYASLQNDLYNGTLPPVYYSPFTNKIWLSYGVYWPYDLPYAYFRIESLEKTYYYWYNPNWPGWFPIS